MGLMPSLQGSLATLFVSVSTSVSTIPMDFIHFTVLNRDGCSFNLNVNASMLTLKRMIADSCDVPFRFGIQLFGETIVSSPPSMNRTIAEIPNIFPVMNDLHEIWGEGFRVPLTVHPITTATQNLTEFTSLSDVFGGPHCNVYGFEWYRFILQCAETDSCTVQELCGRFKEHFMCDDDGKLISIKIPQKLTGNIDLTFLPVTVATMMMAKNSFTEIIGLDQLVGKHLRYLDVRGSRLDLDLDLFTKTSPRSLGNPLTFLRVSVHQLSWSLLGIRRSALPTNLRPENEFSRAVHRAAILWFRGSILQFVKLGRTLLTKTADGGIIEKRCS